MTTVSNWFQKLNAVSYTDDLKQKMGLNYISWPKAYASMMEIDPFAQYEILEYTPKVLLGDHIVDGEPRPYFTDGKTCIVKTRITMNTKNIYRYLGIQADDGDPDTISKNMWLAVMNRKNAAVPVADVTYNDINYAIFRCLVKNIAMFGIALHVYNGEDISGEESELIKLRATCLELIKKKCKLGEAQKEKVGKLCKAAIPEGPGAPGDPENCSDIDVLEDLKRKLMAVR